MDILLNILGVISLLISYGVHNWDQVRIQSQRVISIVFVNAMLPIDLLRYNPITATHVKDNVYVF